MNELAQPGDAPETYFRVNKNLGTFMMLMSVLCEKTYADSGSDHAPPTFVGRNGTELGSIGYFGTGEGIDAFREATFAEHLGTGAEQFEALVFMSEAWVMVQGPGSATPPSLRDEPERREAVVYEARDIHGNHAMGRQFVDRSGGRVELGEFQFIAPHGANYLPSTSE